MDNGNTTDGELSYEQFGAAFIHSLVTPERVQRELKALLKAPIKGVVSRLPAEMIKAYYTFYLQDVQILTRPECLPLLGLSQRITGLISLSVGLLGMKLRFTLQLTVYIEQLVRVLAPLTLKLETSLINGKSVELDVDPHGLPSELLDRLRIIEGAVRAEVVDEVNRRIASGPIASALNIDLLRIAEEARLAAPREPVTRT